MIERARAAGKRVLVDPKGEDWARYRGATLITPNRSEFRQVVGRWRDEAEMTRKAQALRAELDIDALLVTRSEEGMSLYTARSARSTFRRSRARGVRRLRRRRHGDRDARRADRRRRGAAGRGAHRQPGGRRRRRQARHRGRARPTSWTDSGRALSTWPRPGPSTAAPSAAARRPKWQGQCPHCGAWNTLVETIADAAAPTRFQSVAGKARRRAPRSAASTPPKTPRFPTGIEEFDRVLGGGLVPGGVVLLGGDPGHRQVDAAAAGDGRDRRARRRRSTSPARNRSSRSRCARSGSGLVNAPVSLLAEIQLEAIIATIGAEAARGRGHRLDPDRLHRGADLGARQRRAGARMRGAAHAARQAARHRRASSSAT